MARTHTVVVTVPYRVVSTNSSEMPVVASSCQRGARPADENVLAKGSALTGTFSFGAVSFGLTMSGVPSASLVLWRAISCRMGSVSAIHTGLWSTRGILRGSSPAGGAGGFSVVLSVLSVLGRGAGGFSVVLSVLGPGTGGFSVVLSESEDAACSRATSSLESRTSTRAEWETGVPKCGTPSPALTRPAIRMSAVAS